MSLLVLPHVLMFYKRVISPFMAALLRPLGIEAQCRFHPTCSQYAADAVSYHGAWRGGGLAVRRLARCHPWSRGGVDPVPTFKAQISLLPHSDLSHGRNH